jgi:hypothetical protein
MLGPLQPQPSPEPGLELLLGESADLEPPEVGHRLGVVPEQLADRVRVEALGAAEDGEAVPDGGGQDAAEVEQHCFICSPGHERAG